MLKRAVVAIGASLVMSVALAPSASAHQAGPCNASDEPGHSEYAQHHVVPFAQEGALGNGGHKPGSHQGMSLCNPSENRP